MACGNKRNYSQSDDFPQRKSPECAKSECRTGGRALATVTLEYFGRWKETFGEFLERRATRRPPRLRYQLLTRTIVALAFHDGKRQIRQSEIRANK